MRLLGWALIQSNGELIRRGNLDTRNRYTQRKGHVRTQQTGGHLLAKERDLEGAKQPTP